MPYFDGLGFYAESEILWKLHNMIERVACSIEKLDLKPENVHPRIFTFKPGDIIEKDPGQYPTITVLELFTEGFNGVERTPDVLEKLCKSLDTELIKFVNTYKFIVKPIKITLIINMVDRAKYEYHCCEIPLPLSDEEILGEQHSASPSPPVGIGVYGMDG